MDYKNIVNMELGLKSMLGLVFTKVEGAVGDGEMTFVAEDGRRFVFTHLQDCCETVDIADIVGDINDPIIAVHNPSIAVRLIALPENPLIPVMPWSSALLLLNLFNPGIFSRRLIKMSVNAQVVSHKG